MLDTNGKRIAQVDRFLAGLVTLLLRDSWHPGGRYLTRRLGRLMNLTPELRILDLANGVGRSAILLAEEFGCTVTGVDARAQVTAHANE